MSTREKAVDRIRNNVAEGTHVCVAIWQEGDVISRAEANGQEISQEEARDIIDDIDQHQSANEGISWQTIDLYVSDLICERNK